MNERGREISTWRMHSLRLTGPPFTSATDVIRWLGAVQSQDYGPAKWSIGQRMGFSSDAALDQAFDDGVFLRTHVLRPTWHFVLREDIRWMLELTGPRIQAANLAFFRRNGLDDATRTLSQRAIIRALEGGAHLTRREFIPILGAAGLPTDNFLVGMMAMNAELDAVICSGVRKGGQQTYALVEERAPDARRLDRDEALAELTRRFFTSHGPATIKDYTAWCNLTAGEARRGIASLGGSLQSETIGGTTYWFGEPAPRVASPTIEPGPTVLLLQAYDELNVGYRETKRALNVSGAAESWPLDRAVFNNIVILDGQIAGFWKRRVTPDSLIVETALHTVLDEPGRAALQRAADEHGAFLGLPATVIGSAP